MKNYNQDNPPDSQLPQSPSPDSNQAPSGQPQDLESAKDELTIPKEHDHSYSQEQKKQVMQAESITRSMFYPNDLQDDGEQSFTVEGYANSNIPADNTDSVTKLNPKSQASDPSPLLVATKEQKKALGTPPSSGRGVSKNQD